MSPRRDLSRFTAWTSHFDQNVAAILFAVAAWVLAYMLAYRWIPPVITKALVFEWRWRIS